MLVRINSPLPGWTCPYPRALGHGLFKPREVSISRIDLDDDIARLDANAPALGVKLGLKDGDALVSVGKAHPRQQGKVCDLRAAQGMAACKAERVAGRASGATINGMVSLRRFSAQDLKAHFAGCPLVVKRYWKAFGRAPPCVHGNDDVSSLEAGRGRGAFLRDV